MAYRTPPLVAPYLLGVISRNDVGKVDAAVSLLGGSVETAMLDHVGDPPLWRLYLEWYARGADLDLFADVIRVFGEGRFLDFAIANPSRRNGMWILEGYEVPEWWNRQSMPTAQLPRFEDLPRGVNGFHMCAECGGRLWSMKIEQAGEPTRVRCRTCRAEYREDWPGASPAPSALER